MSKTQYRDSARDSVREYLRKIGSFRLLERHEEVELGNTVQRWQKSLINWDKEQGPKPSPAVVKAGLRAREKMVQHNLKLVVSIAKRYQFKGLDLLELIQEGSIGLQRGAEKFDPSRGYKFSTYATWWIRQAMSRSLADLSHTVRLPVHVVEKLNRMGRVTRDANMYGETLTTAQLAERCKYPLYQVENALIASRIATPVSLNTFVKGDKDNSELGEFIPDDFDLAAECEMQLMAESVRKAIALSNLSAKEKTVVELHFGIGCSHAHTLEQIGNVLVPSVTRERVRQIEARAMRKLKCVHSGLHQFRGMVS